ncbi:MAG: V-type ATP synthase subunit E [Treponema sp.]|nr:MAG: V-type ATP synthase subunit E [Treponema sp.]
MEVQLQDIVEKIKSEGVLPAEKKASEIVKSAEEKAVKILEDAKEQADDIIRHAKSEAERFQKASVSAVEQASRNTILTFRDGLLKELNSLINAETAKAYNSEVLKDVIPKTVKAWATHTGEDNLSVMLSPSDAKNLESALLAALKSELGGGIEIKSDKDIAGGFRIGTKDGSAYYDFSSESVAGLFSNYLNPRVAEILKSANKE